MLAFGCFGIKSSIFSINLSLNGSDNHVTTRKQLDQPGHLLFAADGRVWATTWVNAQTFLPPFRSEYRKMIHGGVKGKASSFLFRKTDLHFF